MSLSQVCRDMDPVDSAVRRGVEQYDAEQAGGPGQGKPLTGDQQRIRELEVSRSGLYARRVRAGRPEAVCATGSRLRCARRASRSAASSSPPPPPPPGLIVHSDRGSQYASLVRQAMLQQHVRQAIHDEPTQGAGGTHALEYLMEAAERIEDGLPIPASLEAIFVDGTALGGARAVHAVAHQRLCADGRGLACGASVACLLRRLWCPCG